MMLVKAMSWCAMVSVVIQPKKLHIKNILSISDIVLSLAKIPEAFGRTALEALTLGVPVLAYNHGGAKEILEEQTTQKEKADRDKQIAEAKRETAELNQLIEKLRVSNNSILEEQKRQSYLAKLQIETLNRTQALTNQQLSISQFQHTAKRCRSSVPRLFAKLS